MIWWRNRQRDPEGDPSMSTTVSSIWIRPMSPFNDDWIKDSVGRSLVATGMQCRIALSAYEEVP